MSNKRSQKDFRDRNDEKDKHHSSSITKSQKQGCPSHPKTTNHDADGCFAPNLSNILMHFANHKNGRERAERYYNDCVDRWDRENEKGHLNKTAKRPGPFDYKNVGKPCWICYDAGRREKQILHSAKDCNFSDQSSKKQKKDHVKQVNVIFHDPAMKQAGDAVCIYKNSTNDNHSAMQIDVEESTKPVLSQEDERTPSIQDYKDVHNRLEQLLKDYDQLADIAHHTMEERDKSISDYDLLSKQITSLQKSFDTYTKITEDANQQSNEVTNKLRTTLCKRTNELQEVTQQRDDLRRWRAALDFTEKARLRAIARHAKPNVSEEQLDKDFSEKLEDIGEKLERFSMAIHPDEKHPECNLAKRKCDSGINAEEDEESESKNPKEVEQDSDSDSHSTDRTHYTTDSNEVGKSEEVNIISSNQFFKAVSENDNADKGDQQK